MRLIVCGDSFNVEDDRYPNIHWTDHLRRLRPDIEIVNLSQRGASNGLIALQTLQAIELGPEFVVISFSSIERYEADNPCANRALPTKHDVESIKQCSTNYFQSTKTLSHSRDTTEFDIYQRWITMVQSRFMNDLRNRLIMASCLFSLLSKNIGFCYSPGNLGQVPEVDLKIKTQDLMLSLTDLQAHDPLSAFDDHKLATNFWSPSQPHGPAYFHIMDSQWQEHHCKNIISHINLCNKHG
jgi:hypothetical protein